MAMCVNSRKRCVSVALLLAAWAFGPAHRRADASHWPSRILNPKIYASPSGRYMLFVDPSDPRGRGKASYRMSVDGKAAWSAEKPYTLWEAGVTDDGSVAGYAYSYGPAGYAPPGQDPKKE